MTFAFSAWVSTWRAEMIVMTIGAWQKPFYYVSDCANFLSRKLVFFGRALIVLAKRGCVLSSELMGLESLDLDYENY